MTDPFTPQYGCSSTNTTNIIRIRLIYKYIEEPYLYLRRPFGISKRELQDEADRPLPDIESLNGPFEKKYRAKWLEYPLSSFLYSL